MENGSVALAFVISMFGIWFVVFIASTKRRRDDASPGGWSPMRKISQPPCPPPPPPCPPPLQVEVTHKTAPETPEAARALLDDIAAGRGTRRVTLADLRGIAPDCTGSESSEDFIARSRAEWD